MSDAPRPVAEEKILHGLAVSEGVAIGRAICIESAGDEIYRFPIAAEDIDQEVDRFGRASEIARREVHAMSERVGRELGSDLGGIFEAHALLLGDTHLLDEIEQRIRSEHVNAEWAVWETTETLRERFAQLDIEPFRARTEDLRDVGRYLIRALQGVSHHEVAEVGGDVVVIADDLTPAEAVRLGRQGVAGFALEVGGKTSHTAIIAHSLKIPLVAGVHGLVRLAATEDQVIVDGTRGRVILHPPATRIEAYRAEQDAERALVADLLETRELQAVTRDGVAIRLMANIDLPEELDDALNFGAEGIGLYRSEFLYLERSPSLPTEDDHYALYRQLLEAMAPHPVIIRTYDLGGRKLAREVMETREENPVLGLRGIRLTLARPRVFRTQLRGLFRAGCHGDLWIMLPMVSTVDEVRQFRAFAAEIIADLEREKVPCTSAFKLGIMIEVPSAALIAEHLAREVDFFSIGTNDLIQYAMAVDRNNEHVAALYQPMHPAILHMVHHVVEAARKAQIEVSVCGEMASEEQGAAVLVGLGVRRLSMAPRRLPGIKNRLRSFDAATLSSAATRGLELASAAEVRRLVCEACAATSDDASTAKSPS